MSKVVSVIVPIYNVEEYLPRCIESIISQTYKELEIILVDDGSIDNCLNICEKYAKLDGRVRVVHKKNQGVSSARNSGLDIMTGEFITFVDSDDFLDKNAIERWIKMIEIYNTDIVISSFDKYYDEDTKINQIELSKEVEVLSVREVLKYMLLKNEQICTVWGKLYKKCIFEKLRFREDIFFAEDMYLAPYMFDQAIKIAIDSNVYYHYNQQGTSLVRSEYNIKKLSRIKAARHWLRFIDNRYKDLHEEAYYRYYMILVNELSMYILKIGDTTLDEFKGMIREVQQGYQEFNKNPYANLNDKIKAIIIKKKWFDFYKKLRNYL